MSSDENRAVIQAFWEALYQRDWPAIEAFFAADAEYTDIGTPPEDVARGPAQIVARVRLGFEPVESFHHDLRLMVAEGDVVMTEHTETWRWHTGEEVALPFMTVHELRDGRITRWWDYWDLQTLLGGAPTWWMEHIMAGYG
jgi:limonene-1,2-epoxide hydrolase